MHLSKKYKTFAYALDKLTLLVYERREKLEFKRINQRHNYSASGCTHGRKRAVDCVLT